jgi:NAD(P)-dependent dehydrogenase (short-subunit alcohol dehydrogenase family)
MGYLDRFALDGKVALVPGGGGAIGSAIAGALAGAGAKVAVVDVTQDRADEAAARIGMSGAASCRWPST